jgi:hypothetical protein
MTHNAPKNSRSQRRKIFGSRMIFVSLAAFALLVIGTSVMGAQGQFFGAIFTSLGDGTTVNQNFYDSKSDVYLNGGPQNANAQGLPDGTYYFQVTDPSGAQLLSTDPAVCRQVTVANGVVSGHAAASVTAGCAHANGTLNPITGATPVQLIPFNDTPNNGGEYKVWLIRQASGTTIDADTLHINFDGGNVKTDNFKVKAQTSCSENCNPQTVLSGLKFYDANGNGLNNAEAPVAGVKILIHWDAVDQDNNPISGDIEVFTDASGIWTTTIPTGATYTVMEQLPFTCPEDAVGSYWLQTAPAADSNGDRKYSGTAGSADITGLDFGDICFHPAKGGLTLGFWSNKNGEAIIKNGDNYVGDFTFLNGLNLKNYNGTNFDITPVTGGATAYKNQFRAWLLNGNAVNMAYMLSVQLAATELDVRHGYLDGNQLVDATSLGLGIVSINSIMNAANTELNMTGGNLTFTGSPLRQDEEILKNFLDAVNNNKLAFAGSQPCSVCYPAPAP